MSSWPTSSVPRDPNGTGASLMSRLLLHEGRKSRIEGPTGITSSRPGPEDPDARIVATGDFNAAPDEVPVMAIRGDVENTGNANLVGRILVPIEHTIPAPARYTLFHQGHGEMLDHMLITRNLLAHYRGSEIHNEVLHDESAAFDPNTPNPTTPPSSPPSTSEPVKFATDDSSARGWRRSSVLVRDPRRS